MDKIERWSSQTILVDDGYGSNVTYQVVWVAWQNAKTKTVYIYQRNYSVKVMPMTSEALTYQRFQEHLKLHQQDRIGEQTTRAFLWLLSECEYLADHCSSGVLILHIKPILSFLFREYKELDTIRNKHWTEHLDLASPNLPQPLCFLPPISQDPSEYNVDDGTICTHVETWQSTLDTNQKYFLFVCRNKSQALVILPNKTAVNLWLSPYGTVQLKDVNPWICAYNQHWDPSDPEFSNFLWMRSFGVTLVAHGLLPEMPVQVDHFKLEATTLGLARE